jgi:2-polyprenyl-3-methyl-5-hydroxy-6-metoxy-1,4-benzoquinol methylase
MTATGQRPVEQARLEEMLGRFTMDLGAAMSFPLVLAGEQLGLFAAMADGEPVTPADVAARTDADERYLREWLSAMAAGGYVTYDAGADRFHLEPEQALVLAGEDGPAYIPGAFHVAASVVRDLPKIAEVLRTGHGLGWHEHDHALFHGTERFFRPGYATHLVAEWLPSLQGMTDRLEQGATVTDIGCGHGASTILMARAFPNSRFQGSDYHAASIERARRAAERAGVADRVTFEIAAADSFTGENLDLVCIFDALHDMGDPVGVARRVRQALAPDGTWMIVEPNAGDRLEENLNPVGRVFYSASTAICTPNAKSQEGGWVLGAQAGEARLRDVLVEAGFTHVRRAAETPFNLVLEARP